MLSVPRGQIVRVQAQLVNAFLTPAYFLEPPGKHSPGQSSADNGAVRSCDGAANEEIEKTEKMSAREAVPLEVFQELRERVHTGPLPTILAVAERTYTGAAYGERRPKILLLPILPELVVLPKYKLSVGMS